MKKQWPYFLKLLLLALASGLACATSLAFNICAEDPTIITRKLLPELNTGIAKRLALISRLGDQTTVLREGQLKKDLWKNHFVVKVLPAGKEEVASDQAALQRWACALLTVADSSLPPAGSEITLLLNPHNESTAKLMDEWTKRNAGVYKNLGLRLRWDALGDLQKAQKVLYSKQRPGA